jgi:hypothetical protein
VHQVGNQLRLYYDARPTNHQEIQSRRLGGPQSRSGGFERQENPALCRKPNVSSFLQPSHTTMFLIKFPRMQQYVTGPEKQ